VINPRRAARELALFSLLQPERCQPNGMLSSADIPAVTQHIVRLMVDEAQEAIETAAIDLQAAYAALQEIEWDHPHNLNSPLDAPVVSVTLPKTDETRAMIEKCLKAADLLKNSLSVPFRNAYTQNPDLMRYAHNLITQVTSHIPQLDEQLNSYLDEWRMDRLFRMDACILRLALAEMLYIESVDISVSINEAVELAKQYSSEDSYKLINGVLGKAAQQLGAPHAATGPTPGA
jgi:transcription antitermination protein NusB